MFWILLALLIVFAVMAVLWPLSQTRFEARVRRWLILSSGAIVALVPLVGLGLYFYLGQPDVPDQPLSARLAAAPEQMDMLVATHKIEQHLVQNPKDARGWTILASLYMREGQLEAAIKAYRHVLEIEGESPERNSFLAGLLAAQAQGKAPEEAINYLKRARKLLDPNQLEGWRALIRTYVMIGDKESAQELLSTARTAFAQQPEAQQSLEAMAKELLL